MLIQVSDEHYPGDGDGFIYLSDGKVIAAGLLPAPSDQFSLVTNLNGTGFIGKFKNGEFSALKLLLSEELNPPHIGESFVTKIVSGW